MSSNKCSPLRTDRGVSGDKPVIVERVDEDAFHPVRAMRLDRLPALVVTGLDEPGAEPFDSGQFGRRGGVHHQDGAVRAQRARGQGDPLRRVARADRPDALRQIGGRQLSQGVVGSSNLERPDRLQGFELQVQLRIRAQAGILGRREPHQRRAGDDRVHCVGCCPDGLE